MPNPEVVREQKIAEAVHKSFGKNTQAVVTRAASADAARYLEQVAGTFRIRSNPAPVQFSTGTTTHDLGAPTPNSFVIAREIASLASGSPILAEARSAWGWQPAPKQTAGVFFVHRFLDAAATRQLGRLATSVCAGVLLTSMHPVNGHMYAVVIDINGTARLLGSADGNGDLTRLSSALDRKLGAAKVRYDADLEHLVAIKDRRMLGVPIRSRSQAKLGVSVGNGLVAALSHERLSVDSTQRLIDLGPAPEDQTFQIAYGARYYPAVKSLWPARTYRDLVFAAGPIGIETQVPPPPLPPVVIPVFGSPKFGACRKDTYVACLDCCEEKVYKYGGAVGALGAATVAVIKLGVVTLGVGLIIGALFAVAVIGVGLADVITCRNAAGNGSTPTLGSQSCLTHNCNLTPCIATAPANLDGSSAPTSTPDATRCGTYLRWPNWRGVEQVCASPPPDAFTPFTAMGTFTFAAIATLARSDSQT